MTRNIRYDSNNWKWKLRWNVYPVTSNISYIRLADRFGSRDKGIGRARSKHMPIMKSKLCICTGWGGLGRFFKQSYIRKFLFEI